MDEIKTITPLPSDIQVASTAYPLKVNHTNQCLCYLTGETLSVYQLEPPHPVKSFSTSFGKIPIIAEVLGKSNIVAVVFSSSPKTLAIWDDRQSAVIKELTFDDQISNLHFMGSYLVVCTFHATILYRFREFQLILKVPTGRNTQGLVAGAVNVEENDSLILAVPSDKLGCVTLIFPNGQQTTFQAHQNRITHLALSPNGKFLATSSSRGTIIRLWSVAKSSASASLSKPLQEFRRGVEATTIHALVFHPNSNQLCVTGQTGTAHLYSLEEASLTASKTNQIIPKTSRTVWRQAWSLVRNDIPKYLSSQGSHLQIPVPKNCLPIFTQVTNQIMLITATGQLYKYSYQIIPTPELVQVLFVQL